MYRFGFEKLLLDDQTNTTTAVFIKPQVAKFMASTVNLNDTFPVIQKRTRFVNHYVSQDNLTPDVCFSICKKVAKCAAASFSTAPLAEFNCFLFRKGEFIISNETADSILDFWISYTKPLVVETTGPLTTETTTRRPFAFQAPPTTEAPAKPANIPTKPVTIKPVQVNTCLLESMYATLYRVSSYDQCFSWCEAAGSKCAAACYNSRYHTCHLHKWGFMTARTDSSTIAYVKSEVSAEMAAKPDQVAAALPGISQQTRLVNFFASFDTLTPVQCFNQCRASVICAAASFTLDTKWQFNCYLFRAGVLSLSSEESDNWVSFFKPVAVAASPYVVAVTASPYVAVTVSPYAYANVADYGYSDGVLSGSVLGGYNGVLGYNDMEWM
jgi:hypothetical protein